MLIPLLCNRRVEKGEDGKARIIDPLDEITKVGGASSDDKKKQQPAAGAAKEKKEKEKPPAADKAKDGTL